MSLSGQTMVILRQIFSVQTLRDSIYLSLSFHVVIVIFLILSSALHWFGPAKPSKVTWIRLSKGFTGTEGTPFKNTKAMPQTTIREAKEILKQQPDMKKKEVTKVGTQTPKQILETSRKAGELSPEKPKPQVKAEDKQASSQSAQKILPTAKPAKPKKLSATEQTIRDALAKIKQEVKEREGTEGRPVLEAAQVKQPQGGQSAYGSLDGPSDNLSPELIAYFTEVKKRINEEWVTMPKSFEASDRTLVKVIVTIDAHGKVVSTDWEERSGNYSFDLSAQRAILRASPLPEPPESIREEVVSEGFLIEFNPKRVLN